MLKFAWRLSKQFHAQATHYKYFHACGTDIPQKLLSRLNNINHKSNIDISFGKSDRDQTLIYSHFEFSVKDEKCAMINFIAL